MQHKGNIVLVLLVSEEVGFESTRARTAMNLPIFQVSKYFAFPFTSKFDFANMLRRANMRTCSDNALIVSFSMEAHVNRRGQFHFLTL